MVYQVHQMLRAAGKPVSGPMLQLIANSKRRKLMHDANAAPALKDIYKDAKFGKSWLAAFKVLNLLKLENPRFEENKS
jgi:hypothetical protein